MATIFRPKRSDSQTPIGRQTRLHAPFTTPTPNAAFADKCMVFMAKVVMYWPT